VSHSRIVLGWDFFLLLGIAQRVKTASPVVAHTSLKNGG
jgi:hypothetical protein